MEENVAVLGTKMAGMFIYRDTNAIAHTHIHARTHKHTHTYTHCDVHSVMQVY